MDRYSDSAVTVRRSTVSLLAQLLFLAAFCGIWSGITWASIPEMTLIDARMPLVLCIFGAVPYLFAVPSLIGSIGWRLVFDRYTGEMELHRALRPVKRFRLEDIRELRVRQHKEQGTHLLIRTDTVSIRMNVGSLSLLDLIAGREPKLHTPYTHFDELVAFLDPYSYGRNGSTLSEQISRLFNLPISRQ